VIDSVQPSIVILTVPAQGIHSIQWTALLACTQQVDTATANLEKELQAQLDYAKAQVALLKQQLLLDE